MTECQHDPTYREMNKQAGGTGCPLCNRERHVERMAQGLANVMTPLRWNPVTREMESLHGMTLDELADECIAEMEARCAEQQIDRDTNAGMCN
jgi:hypothetical protein